MTITTPARAGATPGDFFLAPYQGEGAPGPMIVDQAGNLIWFHPLPAGESATNFQVQQYDGQPVLTWWQGHILEVGFGEGEDVIYNNAYQRVAIVRAGNGYHADLHEIRLGAEGRRGSTSSTRSSSNLRHYGGLAAGVLEDRSCRRSTSRPAS